MVLVDHQLLQVERQRVVEKLPRLAQQKGFGVQPGFLSCRLLGQNRCLGGLQHTVQAAQDSEGQDDLAVLGLFVVATRQVGYGPDEGRQVGVAYGGMVAIRSLALKRLASWAHCA